MSSPRGTSNKNQTGSASARRARKRWLLVTFGDGETAPCYRCRLPLTFLTITVDRILAGMDGGKYTRDNIRPACMHCNCVTGNKLMWHRKRFPYLVPVRFISAGASGTLYDVIDGESEDLLTIRSRTCGRTLLGIKRERLVADGRIQVRTG